MQKNILKRAALGACMIISSLVMSMTAFAADTQATISAETAFIRAKITYESAEGLTGLNDSILEFSNPSDWKKDGDYYYYKEPVLNGESVEFISGIKVPNWDNSAAKKPFMVIVTAEAVENMDGKANWADGVVTTSTVAYKNRRNGTKLTSVTKLTVDLDEYEIVNGERVTYKNDKIVVPGERVSKIAVITPHIATRSDADRTGNHDREYRSDNTSDGNGNKVIPIGSNDIIPIISPENTVFGIKIPSIFTGDQNRTIIYLVVGTCALIFLFALAFTRKKKEKSED